MPKKFTAKKFQSTTTQPFENFPNFFNKRSKLMRDGHFERYIGVHQYLKRELEKEYGKANFHVTTGSDNRKFAVWVFEKENCNVYVLTHAEKGTVFEVELINSRTDLIMDEMWEVYEEIAEASVF